MKNLDDILRDPRAHHAELAHDQVQAWSENVLQQWAANNLQAQAAKTAASRSKLASVLFWCSLMAAALMLGSLLWDNLGLPVDSLRSFPSTMLAELAEHSTWLAVGVVSLAVWFTQPLRELLLD